MSARFTRRLRCGERLGPLERGPGRGHVRVVHRRVDVGASGEGFAPRAHRARRVEPLRLAEGADRLGVVEGEGEHEPLIGVPLRERDGGGDGPRVVAHPVEQRRERVRRLARRRPNADEQERSEQEDGQQGEPSVGIGSSEGISHGGTH